MKKFWMCLFVVPMILGACNGTDDDGNGFTRPKEGKGGRVYGGVFRISETEAIQSIYPPSITAANAANVAVQIYEGLVKFSPKDLSIQPAIAERWEIDGTGKEYTFYLKKGVKFHDDPCFSGGKGREVTAHDIKFTFEQICTQSEDNFNFSSSFQDRLLGANDYYEASANGKPDFELEGLKVIDDYTIKLILVKPRPSFPYLLAHPGLSIIAREAVEAYGNKLTNGTGPFMIPEEQSIASDQLVLVQNPHYHGTDSLGNQLPFLDSIVIEIIDSKKAELERFQAGDLAMVHGLPSESIREIVEEQIAHFQSKPPKYILDRSPEMSTQYYQFNMTAPHFKDRRVRHAFNYAIDRNKIIDNVLNGEAYGPGENGICPPSFPGYDITQINGYAYDSQKARMLMSEAGFPNGKGFPPIKLELNSGGFKNTSVAFEVQKQLMDNLNINIDLEVVPFGQKLEDERYARADIFRSAWIADYPSPETFLILFYGKNVPQSLDEPSFPNTPRYVNPTYDELYDKATGTQNQEESYAMFIEAEQMMIDDAPIIVLWYSENYKLMQSDVRNYFSNPMNHQDFSQVYFKPLEAEVTQKGQ